MADLGRWLQGDYRIPVQHEPQRDDEEENSATDGPDADDH
jgi:endogenous inhibitor of DNA gyrase (YacG/DUF329 family)